MKFLADIEVEEGLKDSSGDLGSPSQILSSTGTGTNWIDASSGSIGGSITDNQIAVGAATANDIEGSSGLTWSGSLLDVDGDVQLDGQLNFTSSINRIFSENNTGFDFYLNNTRVGDLNKIFSTGGQWLIYQHSSGNNAKQFPGYSFAANTTTGMFLEDTSILAFATAGESRLIIGSTGDVGIGTGVDAATQRLHVVGNARVTGAYYDSNNLPGSNGQVLSSTNSGTTTEWVTPSSGGGGIGGSITAGQVAFGDTTADEITGSSALTFTGSNTLEIDNSGSTGSTPNLVLNKGSFGQSKILMQNAGVTKLEINCSASDDSSIAASGRLTLSAASGTSPHIIMASASTSRVGIGSTLPQSKLQVNGGIQIADDTDSASSSKVGTFKYYTATIGAFDYSYVDMCMQTDATTYEWVNIITNRWAN